MSANNEKTIAAYDSSIQAYIDGTTHKVSGPIKIWLDEIVDGLPHDAHILEIGSAFGRDADYLDAKGYSVDRTDATPGFIKLQEQLGHNARLLNALTDDFPADINAIFANAVFLHFTPEETASVSEKVYSALKQDGRFGLTLKQGDGEEWSAAKLNAPRYFCYWQPDTIHATLRDAGFQYVDIHTSENNGIPWMQIVAKKSMGNEE